jgi:dTDP-4-amino-4,6-dideoxygalactose transaminase
MPVHQMGMPCDLPAILDIANKHGLPVVEDAACAIGTEICIDGQWQHIGRPHGTIACFSFHPRKVITTGDGGMITTSDAALDRKFRLLRQHAMDVPDTVRHASKKTVFESYPEVGFNYRMTDIQAAVGRVQLKRLPALLERRRAIAARYAQELGGVSNLELPCVPNAALPNFQSYPVAVRADAEPTRDQLMQRLLDCGISTRRGIMNAHQERAYLDSVTSPLPHSEDARDSVLLLPMFGDMTHQEQTFVIDNLVRAMRLSASLEPVQV